MTHRVEGLRKIKRYDYNIGFSREKVDDSVEQSDDGGSGGARRPESKLVCKL